MQKSEFRARIRRRILQCSRYSVLNMSWLKKGHKFNVNLSREKIHVLICIAFFFTVCYISKSNNVNDHVLKEVEDIKIHNVNNIQADIQNQTKETNGSSKIHWSPIAKYIKDIQLKVENIKELCGEICDINDSHFKNDDVTKNKQGFKKQFNCENLFKIELLPQVQLPPKPLKMIPKSLLKYYTYNGQANVQYIYYDDSGHSPLAHLTWTKKTMYKALTEAKRGIFPSGGYGRLEARTLYQAIKDSGDLTNKRALVIGSQSPWIEGMLLHLNASEVTTLEYTKIVVDHPKLRTVQPKQLYEEFLNNPEEFELYDLIVSYSSLEHSGLGRYGDELNPFGDLIEMARARCLLKHSGIALIGIPMTTDPTLIFNGGRRYSHVQIPHFLANWKILNEVQQFIGFAHKIFTIQKY